MFIYKNWDEFCKILSEKKIFSISAQDLLLNNEKNSKVILKHDVETNPKKALKLAIIENKYGHKGTYYVQGYLMKSNKNIEILKQIKTLGHEVSYHHDVMDSNKGNYETAIKEFTNYLNLFEDNDFRVVTVCQHGNPIVNRVGYSSNRDFFRNSLVKNTFPNIYEIMVDYRQKITTNFKYISDAGFGWKLIYDPENDDLFDYGNKNIPIGNLDKVISFIENEEMTIISTHPHRWEANLTLLNLKHRIFITVKFIAKKFEKIKILKKIMSKFYFLAKKL